MSKESREGYRQRLSNGDVVYLIEGDHVNGEGDLVVKKASVISTTLSNGGERPYPRVILWDRVDADPGHTGTVTGKSPRELFTEPEVQRAIHQDEGPLGIGDHTVDDLVANPVTNRELVAVLGSVVILRMADDQVRNPDDPER